MKHNTKTPDHVVYINTLLCIREYITKCNRIGVRTCAVLKKTCLHGSMIKFANSPLCACHGSTGQKP